MPREKQYTVNLNEADKKLIERRSKVRRRPQGELIGYWAQLDEDYNLDRLEFLDRLDDLDDKRETQTVPEGSCPALIYLKDTYVCLWGQENAPPKIRKLTPWKDQLEDACEGCTITKDIANKIRSQEAEIRTLRAAVDVGIVGKIPQCKNGGRLKDDNKMWCPTSGTVKIEHCMTLRGGQPCNYLDMIAMSIKGELPEMEK